MVERGTKRCFLTVSKPTRHCSPVCLSAFLNRAAGLVGAAPADTSTGKNGLIDNCPKGGDATFGGFVLKS